MADLDWTKFLRRYLPDLEEKAIDQIERLIRQELGDLVGEAIAPAYARGLTKTIDAAAAAMAQGIKRGLLRPDQAQGLIIAWVQNVRQQATELAGAIEVYAPLAMSVEIAKQPPEGTTKEEAAAALAVARANRKRGLAGVNTEARDLIEALTGGGD